MLGWRGLVRRWRRKDRPAAPVPRQRQPQEAAIRSRHVWVTARSTGLVVRRRTGYTGWLEVCDLRWADIAALELDSGTHDAARMLYASTRTDPMRTPLIDQAHLTTEQWHLLRDSIAEWTAQGVLLDLAHLGPTTRSRPYEEL
jgi:hypothetical protein